MTLPLDLAELVVDVPGVPVAQGSKRIGRHGRHPVLLDDNDKALKPWRAKITAAAKARAALTGWTVLDGPVSVAVDFWLPRPKSEPNRRRPHVKPDIDKLARACLDSLTGTAIVDDSRVVTLTARKFYAERTPGARITIRSIA